MFINKTAFILGAGASCHYGYPTGEDLVSEVIKAGEHIREFLNESYKQTNMQRPRLVSSKAANPGSTAGVKAQWQAAAELFEDLLRRLKTADPVVIDYFLGQNQNLQEIGRFMIAWVILGCDENPTVSRNKKHNWVRFLVHKLAAGCESSADLLQNKVSFITFNYDVSLERSLLQALSSIQLFELEDIQTFLSENRVIHVYGKVGDILKPRARPSSFHVFSSRPSDSLKLSTWQMQVQQLFDFVYEASKGLRVIDPHDKGDDEEQLDIARSGVSDASCVYILGYGFDTNNSKRLGLDASLWLTGAIGTHPKAVLFTNYDDSNRVNKRASTLLFGNPSSFLSGEPAIIKSAGLFYCEKSTRTVYGALERDFDDVEG
jgi:hypothetical protein